MCISYLCLPFTQGRHISFVFFPSLHMFVRPPICPSHFGFRIIKSNHPSVLCKSENPDSLSWNLVWNPFWVNLHTVISNQVAATLLFDGFWTITAQPFSSFLPHWKCTPIMMKIHLGLFSISIHTYLNRQQPPNITKVYSW